MPCQKIKLIACDQKKVRFPRWSPAICTSGSLLLYVTLLLSVHPFPSHLYIRLPPFVRRSPAICTSAYRFIDHLYFQSLPICTSSSLLLYVALLLFVHQLTEAYKFIDHLYIQSLPICTSGSLLLYVALLLFVHQLTDLWIICTSGSLLLYVTLLLSVHPFPSHL